MTPRQLQYLNKIHGPVIAKYKPTQRHFDLMASYLITSIQEHGAEVRSSSSRGPAGLLQCSSVKASVMFSPDHIHTKARCTGAQQ
jgi:hypothetical protein